MDSEIFTARLKTNAQTIQQMVMGVSDEQANWKPDAESWSILEVIDHLWDEEQTDFRPRLHYIWHQSELTLPDSASHASVTEQKTFQSELEHTLNNFLHEREKSLQWLRSLKNPDWETVATGPWGSIRAGDMFAAWVAHDVLHLRQLVEVHYAWTVKQAQPYQVDYAGPW